MKFSFFNINTIRNLARELSVGLEKLNFDDNFTSFKITVAIPPSSTFQIRNKLQSIPTERIITRLSGNAVISDSSTAWTKDFVYLKNHSLNTITLTVRFLR